MAKLVVIRFCRYSHESDVFGLTCREEKSAVFVRQRDAILFEGLREDGDGGLVCAIVSCYECAQCGM